MTRSHKIIGFLIVAGLGVYGCAKAPSAANTEPDKSPGVQAKVKRLEEDYRAVAAARDQFRQKLLAAEQRQAELQRQLDDAAAERESLKTEIRTRTAERDIVAVQYEGFRKNLKELIAQAEGTLATPAIPPIPTIPSTPTAPAPALVGSQPAEPGPAQPN